ncbi:MAG: hybrid sensor histidine kinase/response regulator [Nitrospirae bacterium]|uniref:sensor histidine kinase n=1 Tax=Candidatus Magnetobacterium casense TaxID=1455061 RepID=UPI00058E59C9|nr:hybrid sensor histidine kinase/response regulator [Candidatus Magnetobacterium casensis]MBF0336776.1 hybrid sensor histidine kinase/response regulator [Nitrospirota bacterium]
MDIGAIKTALLKHSKCMRVLYAEDSRSVREMIADTLNDFFDVVDTAENGAVAMNMYRSGYYDIVISDIIMPELDGIELTRRIKEINPEQSVVITTTCDDAKSMQKLINLGIDKFVIKPIHLKDMLLKLLQITTRINQRKENSKNIVLTTRLSAMTEILSNIAHHWRQPLNVIGLNVQELLELDNEGQLNAQTLKETIDGIMALIMSMSDTIDNFRKHCKPTETTGVFSIVQAVDSAIFIIRDNIVCNGINLIKVYDRDTMITGNERQFSNVLILELLCNSIDALLMQMPQNPCIKIGVTTENDRPVITVFNNGGAIRDDIMGRIYEPYFSTKSVGSGSGLGLYLAKMAVEQDFKGTMNAQNIDDGVEFTVKL